MGIQPSPIKGPLPGEPLIYYIFHNHIRCREDGKTSPRVYGEEGTALFKEAPFFRGNHSYIFGVIIICNFTTK